MEGPAPPGLVGGADAGHDTAELRTALRRDRYAVIARPWTRPGFDRAAAAPALQDSVLAFLRRALSPDR